MNLLFLMNDITLVSVNNTCIRYLRWYHQLSLTIPVSNRYADIRKLLWYQVITSLKTLVSAIYTGISNYSGIR